MKDWDVAVDDLERCFGRSWLTEVDETERHPLRVAYSLPERRKWQAFSHEDAQSMSRALRFVNDLKVLKQFPSRCGEDGTITEGTSFHDKLVAEAKRSLPGFDGAEFEATVARTYRDELRIPIVAITAQSDVGKTPDFEIEHEGETIFAECKSRTTLSPQQARIENVRSALMNRLKTLMDNLKVNYGIRIVSSKEPAADDDRGIVALLRTMTSTGKPFDVLHGDYQVVGQILMPWGSEARLGSPNKAFGTHWEVLELRDVKRFVRQFDSSFEVGKHYRAFVASGQRVERNGGIWHRNPRVALIDFLVVPYHVRSVAAMIKRARAQLRKNCQNVVFVNAPDFYGDDQWKELGRVVRGAVMASSRIGAVVLFHRAVDTLRDDAKKQVFGLKYQCISMKNPKASDPLPDTFFENAVPVCNIAQ